MAAPRTGIGVGERRREGAGAQPAGNLPAVGQVALHIPLVVGPDPAQLTHGQSELRGDSGQLLAFRDSPEDIITLRFGQARCRRCQEGRWVRLLIDDSGKIPDGATRLPDGCRFRFSQVVEGFSECVRNIRSCRREAGDRVIDQPEGLILLQ
ncbi:MAG TPA: hypothetical protein PLR59_08605, partial [Brevundimonas sp.]|nr:hypothetical protein [Brevundimonas sp.]